MKKMIYKNNFRDLYKSNRTQVNIIVNAIAWSHRHTVDADDMGQELIYRLLKSNFLERYDHKKSALNSYVTYRAKFYARHFITEILFERNTSRRGEKNTYLTQVFFSGLNRLQDNESHHRSLVAHDKNPYEVTELNESIELATKGLSEKTRQMWNMYYDGYTLAKVAKEFNMSIAYINQICQKVRDAYKKLKETANA